MLYLTYILLFITAFCSGLLAFWWPKQNQKFIKLLLAFSGAYLFAISIVHLLPEVYSAGNEVNTGIFILIGFFLQIALEFFSEGIEHGHIHVHHHKHQFPIVMMLSLCIHSLLEGMPIQTNTINYSFVVGIIMHNIPIAFILMHLFSLSHIKKSSMLFYLALFAAMAPLGSLLSSAIQSAELFQIKDYFNQIMAIVIGIFLHISTTILFESSENHRYNLMKLFTILLGGILAILLA